MKIENNLINSLQTNKPENTQGVEKNQRAADQSVRVPDKDKAELSEQGRLLAKARAAFDETPPVHDTRVNELKELINKDQYEVPYDELARKLVKHIDIKR